MATIIYTLYNNIFLRLVTTELEPFPYNKDMDNALSYSTSIDHYTLESHLWSMYIKATRIMNIALEDT